MLHTWMTYLSYGCMDHRNFNKFLRHINSLSSSIQLPQKHSLTMLYHFLMYLPPRSEPCWLLRSTENLLILDTIFTSILITHPHIKRGFVHSLDHTASTICQKWQSFSTRLGIWNMNWYLTAILHSLLIPLPQFSRRWRKHFSAQLPSLC